MKKSSKTLYFLKIILTWSSNLLIHSPLEREQIKGRELIKLIKYIELNPNIPI